MPQAITFDDLIPQTQPKAGLSFNDLIPANNASTQPSVGMDVAKSVGSNLAQGALSLPFAFANIGNQFVAGPQLLGRGVAENVDKWLGIDPQPRGDLWQPFYDSNNASQDLGIDYQPKTIAGQAAQIPAQIAGAYLTGKALSSPTASEFMSNQQSGGPPSGGAGGPPSRGNPKIGVGSDLITGSPDIRTYAGEKLGAGIQQAEATARNAKDAAYKTAQPALESTNLPSQPANDLASALVKHASDYDEDLVPASKLIKKYAGEIASSEPTQPPLEDILMGAPIKKADTKPVTLDDIELLRKKINNIPVKDNATGKLVSGAKQIFDQKMDEYVNNGIVQGDPEALNLIKDARAKNAYWRQKFTGNQANAAISKYLDSVGGPEQIAPENLLDMFTRVGQTGLDNVKAAKDILGNDAVPILKNGYVNRLRSKSVDAAGNINPKLLAKQIDVMMNNNPSLMKELFNQDELNALRAVQRESLAYANGKGNPKFITKLTTKIPGIGPLVEEAIRSRAKSQMVNDLTKAAKGQKP